MVDNQHKKISGYRDLTEADIAAMNDCEGVEAKFNAMIDRLRELPGVDQRNVALAQTHGEDAFMRAVRSIAQPARLLPDVSDQDSGALADRLAPGGDLSPPIGAPMSVADRAKNDAPPELTGERPPQPVPGVYGSDDRAGGGSVVPFKPVVGETAPAPPHVMRMIREWSDLRDRLTKLEAFMDGSVFLLTLPEDEQIDMADQRKAMEAYLDALTSRLVRAGWHPAEGGEQ